MDIFGEWPGDKTILVPQLRILLEEEGNLGGEGFY